MIFKTIAALALFLVIGYVLIEIFIDDDDEDGWYAS